MEYKCIKSIVDAQLQADLLDLVDHKPDSKDVNILPRYYNEGLKKLRAQQATAKSKIVTKMKGGDFGKMSRIQE